MPPLSGDSSPSSASSCARRGSGARRPESGHLSRHAACIGRSMDRTRRALVAGAVGAAVSQPFAAAAQALSSKPVALGTFGIEAATLGLRAGGDDQSRVLARAVAAAAGRNAPLLLAPGEYRIADVLLPDNARIVGVPGATRLVQAGRGPMLAG